MLRPRSVKICLYTPHLLSPTLAGSLHTRYIREENKKWPFNRPKYYWLLSYWTYRGSFMRTNYRSTTYSGITPFKAALKEFGNLRIITYLAERKIWSCHTGTRRDDSDFFKKSTKWQKLTLQYPPSPVKNSRREFSADAHVRSKRKKGPPQREYYKLVSVKTIDFI